MAIITRNVPRYPPHWPAPRRVNYSADIDYGVLRTGGLVGLPEQGRHYQSSPTTIAAEFQMSLTRYYDWQAWVSNDAMHGYCSMPVVDQYTGQILAEQVVRFMPPFEMRPLGGNEIVVRCQMYVLPQDIGDGHFGIGHGIKPPESATHADWIIAKSPADPSPEWVLAGTPGAPSPEWVLAETPLEHH